jgi:signal transduction histidine kinase
MGCLRETNTGIPYANYGLLDLSGWNFNQKEMIPLVGDWEFHWKELYSENQSLIPREEENPEHYVKLPGVWNNKSYGNESVTGEGYATVRLQILLPHTNKDLAIVFPKNFYTVHAIWINGTKREWNGIPGPTPELTNFTEYDLIDYIILDSTSIDLIVEISNFRGNTRWGGIRNPFYIGKVSTVKTETTKKHFLAFFIFSCILSIGIYHLFLFQNYKKDKLPLYFAIFSLIVSSYSISTSSVWINLFPTMSPNQLFRLEFFLEILLTPACYIFLRYIFPKDLPKSVLIILIVIVSIFAILIPSLPITNVSHIYGYSLYIPLVFGTYLLAMIFKAYIMKREFAGSILLSVAILFIFMLNDVMHGLVNVLFIFPYSFPLGLLAFIAIQSHMISVRQAKAFQNAEQLVVLENKFKEQSRNQAEERSRIARDIHDSIGSEITALMTYVQARTDKPEDTINKMKQQLAGVLINIRDIVYLLGQDKKEQDILEGEIAKYIERLKTSKKYKIDSHIDSVSSKLGIEKSLNTQRIFLELMTNIIRHSKATEIRIDLFQKKNTAYLIIINNGIPFTWDPSNPTPGTFGLDGLRIRSQKMNAKFRFLHVKTMNYVVLKTPFFF